MISLLAQHSRSLWRRQWEQAHRRRPPVSRIRISATPYIYLLGRLLVTRQQQLDFKEGFKWNELVHRKPGGLIGPIPISMSPIPKRG